MRASSLRRSSLEETADLRVGRGCSCVVRWGGFGEASRVNLQVEDFISVSGGRLVATLDDALAALAKRRTETLPPATPQFLALRRDVI